MVPRWVRPEWVRKPTVVGERTGRRLAGVRKPTAVGERTGGCRAGGAADRRARARPGRLLAARSDPRGPADRWRTCLSFLTSASATGLVRPHLLDGLHLRADDVDWTHGAGPPVRGDAGALALALTGRTAALEHLDGEGAEILRLRLS